MLSLDYFLFTDFGIRINSIGNLSTLCTGLKTSTIASGVQRVDNLPPHILTSKKNHKKN